MTQKINISTWSIIKIFLVLLSFYFLWNIINILVMLFVVLIIVSALSPLVEFLEKKHIPRLAGIIGIYLIIALLFGAIIYLIIPPLVTQLIDFANSLPYYLNKFSIFYQEVRQSAFDWNQFIKTIADQLGKVGQGFYSAALSVFGGFVSAVTVIVLSFYLLIEKKSVGEFILSLIPQEYKQGAIDVSKKIATKMGGWLRGQVILSLTIGIVDFIGLLIVGVPYALTLGVLAALFEVIPVIGPVLAAVVAILVTLTTVGWVKALIVLAIYTGVQQLEAHILVPKIMEKSVGISPAFIIIALLIGSKIDGLTGALLAIPAAAAISVIFQEYQKIIKN